ncbi:MAG: hypothetical protein C0426_16170 [Rhodobacter sp.]|nr:hypothetical protein [Rhodobacter sp.]
MGFSAASAMNEGDFPARIAFDVAIADALTAETFSDDMRAFSLGNTRQTPAIPIIRMPITICACISIMPVFIDRAIICVGVIIGYIWRSP